MALGPLEVVRGSVVVNRDNIKSLVESAPNSVSNAPVSVVRGKNDRVLPWVRTPYKENKDLSEAAGCRVFEKLEFYQPSRSFKSRGIGNRLYQCVIAHESKVPQPAAPISFYSCSAGNAGLAAATAATLLAQKSTVVVPQTTTCAMQKMIAAAGAHVIVHGTCILEADNLVRRLAEADPSGIYVSPFDHEDIWAGNSTVIDELYEQTRGEAPDVVVCSVGGGGLLNGVLLGLDRYGWDDTTVLAMETGGADSLAQSVHAGRIIVMPELTSIAKSLGVGEICAKTWDLVNERNARGKGRVECVVLSDAEAAMACVRYTEKENVVIEPACGVSIAGAYNGLFDRAVPGFSKESKVVIIVCGGSTVSLADVSGYTTRYADQVC